MDVTIKIDEEALAIELLQNLPEYAVSFVCTKWDYDHNKFILIDKEDNKTYTLTLPLAVAGLAKLLEAIAAGKFPGLGLNPATIADAGNWDAGGVDALLQMALLGEVIYG